MQNDDKIWWEVPRRPDTEWLFKSVLDEENENGLEAIARPVDNANDNKSGSKLGSKCNKKPEKSHKHCTPRI